MDIKLLSGIFLEGILSFLSPCVLPLIPLYVSYLAGENRTVDKEGKTRYDRIRVFLSTLFFVLGISTVFILLAASVSAVSRYIETYSEIISIIGGTLIIIFGLHELGLIHIDVLNRELKPRLDLHPDKMNLLKAYLLGFVFSLGWSPCIGPMLANALLMAATSVNGYLYILAYALGLIIPFLITGLFTNAVVEFFSKRKDIVTWIMKIAGVILIIYGLYMISGAAKNIISLKQMDHVDNGSSAQQMSREEVEEYLYNLELKDGEGNTFRLSDIQDKYIFLNFTTTWCTFCKMEMPDYKTFAENEEVKCFYVMSPKNEYGADDIDEYIRENGIEAMTIIDENAELFYYCGISAYPTTFVVGPNGRFLTYASGMLSLDNFNTILEYAKSIKE